MEMNGKLPPVGKKKSKLDPITPDIFRRSTTGFGINDNSKAIQALMEENEQLKNELEIARKEIFRLKEENLKLKKDSRGSNVSTKSTFLTSNGVMGQNGGAHEETKTEDGSKVWHNWDQPIAKQNFSLHVIYWEKNLTECSYWKMKLNRADLDNHIDEERGNYSDLLEAVSKGKISDIDTMYEHGNDIFALSEDDTSKNTLLHIAVQTINIKATEFLIKKGINVNTKNANNETPLHHAVAIKNENKAVEIIDMMLIKGADPHIKDKLGDTPIEKAKRLGKSEILLLFADRDESRVGTPSVAYRL